MMHIGDLHFCNILKCALMLFFVSCIKCDTVSGNKLHLFVSSQIMLDLELVNNVD